MVKTVVPRNLNTEQVKSILKSYSSAKGRLDTIKRRVARKTKDDRATLLKHSKTIRQHMIDSAITRLALPNTSDTLDLNKREKGGAKARAEKAEVKLRRVLEAYFHDRPHEVDRVFEMMEKDAGGGGEGGEGNGGEMFVYSLKYVKNEDDVDTDAAASSDDDDEE